MAVKNAAEKNVAVENVAVENVAYEERDILTAGEKKQEGGKAMEQKVYKVMKGAGAANIAVGVITLTVGIVTGVLLLVTGGRLIAGKSKILF